MTARKKQKLVVLTGAGISAESGLKTFRDSDGLWEGQRVEDVATPEAWQRDAEQVLRFYNERRRQVIKAEPNAAHLALAALEEHFDVQIITQNIDDLHERAGSTSVLHLHGEIRKMRSEHDDPTLYPIDGDIAPGSLAPDGGRFRPHVVWFGESVPMIVPAAELSRQADLFAVVGTSLVVYPAAGLLQYVPPQVPVYVIDRKIPDVRRKGITTIEKPATEGMKDFMRVLMG